VTLTFREGHIEADGFPIKYLEAGQGSTVVILEAITWGISRLRDALAQKYRVVALELPGFGSSAANTRSSSVSDLAGTTVQAAAKLVPEKYTLMGTSFAANVALWHTLLAPDQVEALVLVSPTALLPLGNPAVSDPGEQAKLLLAHPENSSGLPHVAPDIAAKERELIQRLGGDTHDAEVESRLGEIQCPTLVVFGSQDRLMAGEAGSIYRRDIPNCNVSIVYDAGHLIVAERPEALISTVADFVERRETFIVSRRSWIINP
jgi:4,5:9,10-diseco-3-hydroxy-5,9,17-trioxoandrosta-1(10),2-diene-4-oate hydrolase